jgi:uncharacterized protein (DUF1501 family)
MNVSRREFLTASSGVAAGLGLPHVFQQAALAAPQLGKSGSKDTVLVVVQLTGGNDGLNTVIPIQDPTYASQRPKLRQPKSKIHSLNKELALHPDMSGFAKLWEDSNLSIVQGVGYPNANRSHFSSMDIWHKASRSKEQRYGWLGRSLAGLGGSNRAMHVGKGKGPLALFSSTGNAPSLKSLTDYQLRLGKGKGTEATRQLIESFAEEKSQSDKSSSALLTRIRKTAQQTYESSRRIQKVAKSKNSAGTYPKSGLATRLQLIARLIHAEVPERVFYTTLDGFDTHAAQAAVHGKLLRELSDGITAFQNDLKKHGQHRRVLVMTFSEFGRRVRENGSDGTDHGAASQIFLIGDAVKPGIIGKHPSLTDLTNGDLKHHTDFRSVYSTLLNKWLGVPAEKILAKKHPNLPLLATR